MSRRIISRVMTMGLLVPGLVLLGERAWMAAKAGLADRLIARALQAHLRDGQAHPPWGWADTWPLASLECHRLGVRRAVLAGSSGSSLAFGLGHLDGTAAPNAAGHCVLAGHRDRQARFLRALRPGDRLHLASHGDRRVYVVDRLRVVHETESWVTAPTRQRQLTLVTCWPFDGLVGGPWRYVVICRELDEARFTAPTSGAGGPGDRGSRRSAPR